MEKTVNIRLAFDPERAAAVIGVVFELFAVRPIKGGDPLTFTDERLDHILGEIRRRAPHVRFLRIGSRMVVQLPTRITPELCAVLEKHRVQMVNIHINHPKEITPLLRQRAHNELREVEAVATRHASRYALVPLLRDEPIGEERLLELSGRVLARV